MQDFAILQEIAIMENCHDIMISDNAPNFVHIRLRTTILHNYIDLCLFYQHMFFILQYGTK